MQEGLENIWFWRELEEGQIHFRDRLQFELKSEFRTEGPSTFLQEIYLFIPESLQINRRTYSQDQFYLDEINLIRYKTPSLTFEELLNPANQASPLNHLTEAKELKMFANIFRSRVRESVKEIFDSIEAGEDPKLTQEKTLALIANIRAAKSAFSTSKSEEKALIEEFLRLVVENYMTGLLYHLRQHQIFQTDQALSRLIVDEGLPEAARDPVKEEEVLLRSSQLNKYMYEALALKNVRVEVKKKHGAWIGMGAAGVAMLVYMSLFVWKADTFGINSVPFVMLAVFFYILKDRVKEGLKDLYQKNAYRWFPDYSTEIETPQGKSVGFLNESFQFIDEAPEDIVHFRERLQNHDPEEFRTSESILQYKKELIITSKEPLELNTIFRYNIHKFVEKAGDEVQVRLKLNPETFQIHEKKLPKVYYLTVLLKNTIAAHTELKKFRVILNKSGIERVQYLVLN